jgi:hypothetical protein
MVINNQVQVRTVFLHPTPAYYALTQPFKDWPAGTLVMRGAYSDSEGYEYFNLTDEIQTDQLMCYSDFNLPFRSLRAANQEEVNYIQDYFNRIKWTTNNSLNS